MAIWLSRLQGPGASCSSHVFFGPERSMNLEGLGRASLVTETLVTETHVEVQDTSINSCNTNTEGLSHRDTPDPPDGEALQSHRCSSAGFVQTAGPHVGGPSRVDANVGRCGMQMDANHSHDPHEVLLFFLSYRRAKSAGSRL